MWWYWGDFLGLCGGITFGGKPYFTAKFGYKYPPKNPEKC